MTRTLLIRIHIHVESVENVTKKCRAHALAETSYSFKRNYLISGKNLSFFSLLQYFFITPVLSL
jgi:hypothetical protein